jgi:ubiquitin carboxyl-terminal hydrolase 10
VHTIEDTLARISHPHPLQLGSSGLSEASQQVLVEELPQILVLHLKRFLYDGATNGIVKISKPVRFPPELVIPLGTILFYYFPVLSRLIFPRGSVDSEIMAPNFGKSVEPAHYKLYGVLYHHGDSASIGHYTVDVLHSNEGGGNGKAWMHVNDEVVSAVRHEDVFGGYVNDQVDDRCAYMLFYCRCTPTQI